MGNELGGGIMITNYAPAPVSCAKSHNLQNHVSDCTIRAVVTETRDSETCIFWQKETKQQISLL